MAVLADGSVEQLPVRWMRAGVHEAGPLALAGLAANAGSVLVTVVLARLLEARDYGSLNQLIGIFFVVSTPGSAVLVAVVRRVTAWQGDPTGIREWARGLHRRATWVLVAFSVVVVASGPAIAGLLGDHDVEGLDTITVAGGVWVLLCVDRGLLQGHREYRTLSSNFLVEGGLRTALMLLLAGVGAGVAGVAAGVCVAEIGTALHARIVADRAWRAGASPRWSLASTARSLVLAWRRSDRRAPQDGRQRGDLLSAVVALAAIALLQYIDVIEMAKSAPRAAGAYAAVSVSCKALVFVALVVAGYLLPEAAISARDGGHALRQLGVALGLVAVPAVALLGVAFGAPRPFLGAFFSSRYVSAAGAFAPLALAMVCLSASVMLTMYLLGVGDRKFAAVLLAAAAGATVVIALAHGSPRPTAVADLCVQTCLLAAAAGELTRVHRRRITPRRRRGRRREGLSPRPS